MGCLGSTKIFYLFVIILFWFSAGRGRWREDEEYDSMSKPSAPATLFDFLTTKMPAKGGRHHLLGLTLPLHIPTSTHVSVTTDTALTHAISVTADPSLTHTNVYTCHCRPALTNTNVYTCHCRPCPYTYQCLHLSLQTLPLHIPMSTPVTADPTLTHTNIYTCHCRPALTNTNVYTCHCRPCPYTY